jgi:hypothetical protein
MDKKPNAVSYVVHVGIHNSDANMTTRAKGGWNAFAATIVPWFQPA